MIASDIHLLVDIFPNKYIAMRGQNLVQPEFQSAEASIYYWLLGRTFGG